MASRVTRMSDALSAFSSTSTQSEKTSANSWHCRFKDRVGQCQVKVDQKRENADSRFGP